MINNSHIEDIEFETDGKVWETVIDFREIIKEGVSLEEALNYL